MLSNDKCAAVELVCGLLIEPGDGGGFRIDCRNAVAVSAKLTSIEVGPALAALGAATAGSQA